MPFIMEQNPLKNDKNNKVDKKELSMVKEYS